MDAPVDDRHRPRPDRGPAARDRRFRRRAPRRDPGRRPWSGRRAPSSATTRRTPRCSPPRCSARRRGRSRPIWRAASSRGSATTSTASRSPGPGFLNLYMSESWMRAAVEYVRRRGREFGSGLADAPGIGPRRVRQRQPDRAADRGQRPAPGVRRLARPGPRVRRSPGEPRVLPERRRRADRPVRRLDRGADRRDRRARGRLRGRLRGRARRADRGREPGGGGRSGAPARAGRRADARVDQGDARPRPGSATTPGARSRSSTTPTRSTRRSPTCAIASSSTTATARSGCGPRSSATTRTAS